MLIGDIRTREDLSPVIDTLFLTDNDMRYLSFVRHLRPIKSRFGAMVTKTKHEWRNLAARVVTVTSGTSGAGVLWNSTGVTASLPIASGDITKIRVGDVLLLPNGSEQVVVKTVTTGSNTIDVYGRGHGGSTATAQPTTAFTVTIIGNAQVEGGDAMTANFQGFTEDYNYVQEFEDVADESLQLAIASGADFGDALDMAVAVKTKETLRLLNRALIYGLRNNDTTNKVATMGGLRQFISNTSNVGGSLTEAKLYSALETHLAAGLVPTAIHGSIHAIAALEQLYTGKLQMKSDERRAGLSVAVITALGFDLELRADRDMLSSEMLIVDDERIAYGAMENGQVSGALATYDLPANGKKKAKQVLGLYTGDFRNGAGTRCYGIS
ncbi:MAG: DUF5309 domain-containing protein [Candidatus Moranbacteria bacterium]|nr:DUF5309 domain-containing protein [Candidatus Moranbacteria bacterium]